MSARLLAIAASLALMGCSEEVHPPRSMPPPPSELVFEQGSADGTPVMPEVISRVEPEYPDEARRAGVQGTVYVNTLVRADGTARVTKVIGSIPLLDKSARACVDKWHFKPGTLNGRSVELWIAVPVKFVLP